MCSHAVAWIVLALAAAGGGTDAGPPLEVRVGLLAYGDFHQELRDYDRLFAELGRASARPVRFRLAAGTYADIEHWLDRGLIDVAVVTSGIVARQCTGAALPCKYLATLLRLPARSALALDDRRQPGRYDRYRSACVVRADSPLRNVRRSATGDRRRAGATAIHRSLVHFRQNRAGARDVAARDSHAVGSYDVHLFS